MPAEQQARLIAVPGNRSDPPLLFVGRWNSADRDYDGSGRIEHSVAHKQYSTDQKQHERLYLVDSALSNDQNHNANQNCKYT
jgi:hypothetical protein